MNTYWLEGADESLLRSFNNNIPKLKHRCPIFPAQSETNEPTCNEAFKRSAPHRRNIIQRQASHLSKHLISCHDRRGSLLSSDGSTSLSNQALSKDSVIDSAIHGDMLNEARNLVQKTCIPLLKNKKKQQIKTDSVFNLVYFGDTMV